MSKEKAKRMAGTFPMPRDVFGDHATSAEVGQWIPVVEFDCEDAILGVLKEAARACVKDAKASPIEISYFRGVNQEHKFFGWVSGDAVGLDVICRGVI